MDVHLHLDQDGCQSQMTLEHTSWIQNSFTDILLNIAEVVVAETEAHYIFRALTDCTGSLFKMFLT